MEVESWVKKEFVRQKLTEEGREMLDEQGKAIRKLLQFRTGHLLNDRTMSISGSDSLEGNLQFSIPNYGRFLDINPKRRNTTNTSNFEYWRNRRKRNFAYAIYNRYVFGLYYGLAYRLRYGLTEDVAAAIKRNFIKEI